MTNEPQTPRATWRAYGDCNRAAYAAKHQRWTDAHEHATKASSSDPEWGREAWLEIARWADFHGQDDIAQQARENAEIGE